MKSHIGGLIQFAAQDTNVATLSGHIYRKQLAKYGEWVNPEYPYLSSDPIMTLDETWGEKIVENFNSNTLGSPVPVPLNHTNDVKENTGKVQSVESVPGDGLYGNLLIADEDTISKLDKGVIFDVSISFDWNHTRTDNGKSYGPTLLHVALVNNPYLIEMNSFEKIGPALSKLEESFKPIGLASGGTNAIMLSRDKMKELSKMATTTLKNEKEFAITFAYDGADVTLQPGEEVTVNEDDAESVAALIAEAEAITAEAAEGTDEPEEETESEPEGETETDSTEEEEDEKTELSRLRLENVELQLSREYDSLLAEGKVIPAQKDKIMALGKLSQGVQLSTDTKTDLTTVVLDILRSGKQQFSTDESGSSKEDEEATDGTIQNNESKKPSETLTEEEAAGFKAVGADPQKMDELAEKDPVFAAALASLSKK